MLIMIIIILIGLIYFVASFRSWIDIIQRLRANSPSTRLIDIIILNQLQEENLNSNVDEV